MPQAGFQSYSGNWASCRWPMANLVGASLCYVIGQRTPWGGAAVYALMTAGAVSLMLSVLFRAPFAEIFPAIGASEMVLIAGGVPIVRAVLHAVQPIRQRWAESKP